MTVTQPTTPKLRRLPRTAGADTIFTTLQEDGIVIIEDFMSAENVAQFNAEIDPHLKKWELGQFKSYQEDYLSGMRQLSSLSLFNKKAFGPECGDCWLTTSSVLETEPGYGGQELHREYEGIPICTKLGKQSPESMLNFTALTDFTAENGAIRVLPGSHPWDDFSAPPPPADTAIPAAMNPGDAVLLTGKTLYGAGKNNTTDFLRRGFPLIMQSCQFTQMEAPKMVGWRTVSANGVNIWTYDLKDLATGIQLKNDQPAKAT
ncbi:PhyH-domain-containing protein [Penicillium concentricum]|uniref:PhyH-domain-containing protein n=1 Tax=Penicillium concentricum TaxID=293559 RepID=A0A9W9RB98_9EURO|nr:PhyH-domain-containing protein [Penicillium concentricum]KAJ5357006.1 PhyH-domain-containing protein [Penicillium concentricum]